METRDHAHGHDHAPHVRNHGPHHQDHGPDVGDSYYQDQLCMVAMAGAFGGICLALYFWQTGMLNRILGSQFHPFVLGSGIALVILAVLRAVSLWIQVGEPVAANGPNHEHDHRHDHNHEQGEHCHHEGCGHDHQHEQNHQHEHGHDHIAHGHHHHHDHGAEDHDHAFTPLRYVILLIPIILFLLGLPNKGPKVMAADSVDVGRDSVVHALGLIGNGGAGWAQAGYAGYLAAEQASGEVFDLDFKDLLAAAASEPRREQWNKKTVRVIGQFATMRSGNPNMFALVRFRMQCCAADAIQFDVPCVSREPITHVKANDWVRVTGRISFIQSQNGFKAVLIVSGHKAIVPTYPDPNPWIQF